MAGTHTKWLVPYAARGSQGCMPPREVTLGCLVVPDMDAKVLMGGGATSTSWSKSLGLRICSKGGVLQGLGLVFRTGLTEEQTNHHWLSWRNCRSEQWLMGGDRCTWPQCFISLCLLVQLISISAFYICIDKVLHIRCNLSNRLILRILVLIAFDTCRCLICVL